MVSYYKKLLITLDCECCKRASWQLCLCKPVLSVAYSIDNCWDFTRFPAIPYPWVFTLPINRQFPNNFNSNQGQSVKYMRGHPLHCHAPPAVLVLLPVRHVVFELLLLLCSLMIPAHGTVLIIPLRLYLCFSSAYSAMLWCACRLRQTSMFSLAICLRLGFVGFVGATVVKSFQHWYVTRITNDFNLIQR